jgi:hypothetical protein
MNKLRSSIFYGFVLMLCLSVSAQIRDVEDIQYDSLSRFTFFGNIGLLSDQVPYSFSQLFFQGGMLEENDIQATVDRLQPYNRFGFHAEYGFSISMSPEYINDSRSRVCSYGGYEYHNLLFLSFTDDLFRLIFQGNEFTLGETGTLDNSRFSAYAFHKVYAGSKRTIGKNNNIVFGIAPFVSFHKPPVIFEIEEGSIYTEPDTSSIRLLVDGKLVSGLEQEKLVQSLGGGIDVFVGSKELIPGYYTEVSLNNFGVYGGFRGRVISTSGDKFVEINGVSLGNLQHPDSVLINYADSLSGELGFSDDTLIVSEMLPWSLQLEMISLSEANVFVSGKLSWYPQQHSMPFIELYPQYRISPAISAGIPLAWGGMGGIQTGVFCSVRTGSVSFRLNLTHVRSFSGLYHTGYYAAAVLNYKFKK